MNFFGKIIEKGPNKIKYRDFSEKNMENFRIKVGRIDWKEILDEDEVNFFCGNETTKGWKTKVDLEDD